MSKTLFEKIWDAHVVKNIDADTTILYIDKHLIHEVTSPQAFKGIEDRGISVFRPKSILATTDHNVPTINQHLPIIEIQSRLQVEKLKENCSKHDIELFGLGHPYQGIIHVISPELGVTLPGMTIVCGDSHTSTHGAFGAIAFGIGTSEVEQVFATQCILQNKPKTMKIEINGKLNQAVLSKDIVLYILSKISASGATGYFIEFAGDTIKKLSMEARMTICNMSIEMGAKGGLIAPDETTIAYINGRKFAPKNAKFEEAKEFWKTLYSDENATFDKVFVFQAENFSPMITYGTNPGMGIKIGEPIPKENSFSNESNKKSFNKAISYMDFKEGEIIMGKKINFVFIGSCTNSRIEDLRIVARYVKGKKKAENVYALIVPGSQQVAKQAKAEGLDKILIEAGFELREPGCSACLAMNEDKIPAGEYCVSTSNRNFEGRQGPGSRTLLASPLTAAAVAINGYISDPRIIL